MRSNDYNYNPPNEEYIITEERKEQLIQKVKDKIRQDSIPHYQILGIGKNDEEWDFLYDWLDNNDIQIRGIDRNG